MGWMKYGWKQRQLERKRKQRLITKLQKARAIDRIHDVWDRHTWNARFRAVQAMRAERVA